MDNLDTLWKKSEIAAKRLQEIADQMAERAKTRQLYGVENAELDQIIAANHYQALRRVLELGEKLEEAAVEAGILKKLP